MRLKKLVFTVKVRNAASCQGINTSSSKYVDIELQYIVLPLADLAHR